MNLLESFNVWNCIWYRCNDLSRFMVIWTCQQQYFKQCHSFIQKREIFINSGIFQQNDLKNGSLILAFANIRIISIAFGTILNPLPWGVAKKNTLTETKGNFGQKFTQHPISLKSHLNLSTLLRPPVSQPHARLNEHIQHKIWSLSLHFTPSHLKLW